MSKTATGDTLSLGDVAYIRETQYPGSQVRRVLVLGENGDVLTLDTWNPATNEWAEAPYYVDATRVEVVYRPVTHDKKEVAAFIDEITGSSEPATQGEPNA